MTTYHATDQPPVHRPVLLLDGTGRSGIANSIVVTLAAPGYAPAGRHLVATTAPAEADLDEVAIRRHLAVLYGQPTGNWEHIRTVRAEPGPVTAPPPQGRLRKPTRLSDTLWTFSAGFHRLLLRHSAANPASCRVAAKSGFAAEGTERGAGLRTDGWHDMHLHARIATG